jgi:hypothetical protein
MKHFRKLIAAVIAVCICLTCMAPVETYAAKKKYSNEWVEKNGRFYYYNEKGKKLRGLQTVGDETYYFDEKGRQRVGWVQVDDDYYFFTIRRKSKGSMVKSTEINGIKIKKSGKAKVTKKNSEKLRLLVAANELVFENTKSTMKKSEKLKTMFTGLATADLIVYKNLGSFESKKSNWQEYYAACFFDKGYGDCYAAACAFAYIATAIGYDEVYAQSSGGHGWCKINEKFYDPNWAWWGTSDIDKAYAVPAELSGKNKRPNWAKYQIFSKKIS